MDQNNRVWVPCPVPIDQVYGINAEPLCRPLILLSVPRLISAVWVPSTCPCCPRAHPSVAFFISHASEPLPITDGCFHSECCCLLCFRCNFSLLGLLPGHMHTMEVSLCWSTVPAIAVVGNMKAMHRSCCLAISLFHCNAEVYSYLPECFPYFYCLCSCPLSVRL